MFIIRNDFSSFSWGPAGYGGGLSFEVAQGAVVVGPATAAAFAFIDFKKNVSRKEGLSNMRGRWEALHSFYLALFLP